MGWIINLVLLLIFLLLFVNLNMRRRESYEGEEEVKFPVGDFTLEYIKNNTNASCANSYFKKIEIAEPNSTLQVPKPTAGTILDVPKTYTSSWI